MPNEHPQPSPSILATAERLVDEAAVDGLAAGVVVEDGNAGAEVAFKRDVGEPGGWALGATGRWVKNTGRRLAAFVTWKPK